MWFSIMQWRNAKRFLTGSSKFPVCHQFIPVDINPNLHHPKLPGRKVTGEESPVFNGYRRTLRLLVLESPMASVLFGSDLRLHSTSAVVYFAPQPVSTLRMEQGVPTPRGPIHGVLSRSPFGTGRLKKLRQHVLAESSRTKSPVDIGGTITLSSGNPLMGGGNDQCRPAPGRRVSKGRRQ